MQKTLQAVNKFLQQTYKCFITMKTSIKKIWLMLLVFVAVTMTSCNVTRKTTTESSFYQRGDTAVHITTKTIESYDATKKL